jgi:hypothetical protein
MAASRREHAQVFGVVQVQRLIGEEHLQAPHAIRDEQRHLLVQHRIGGSEMIWCSATPSIPVAARPR